MQPQEALNILAQATGDPSLKLNRQETHLVEQAIVVLQSHLNPPQPEPEPTTDGVDADGHVDHPEDLGVPV
jgi:hypothetical protein